MDFVDERDVTIGNAFCSEPEQSDEEAGRYEEKCLSEGIINAYKAYDAGVYQANTVIILSETNIMLFVYVHKTSLADWFVFLHKTSLADWPQTFSLV